MTLVVDDEPLVRNLLVRTLESESEDVLQASSWEEALDLYMKKDVAVAIVDIHMPGRSGLDLLADLKAVDRDAVVIMITGLPEIDSAAEAVRAGAYDYLRKPFDRDTVCASVRRAHEHRELLLARRRYHEHLEHEVRAQTRKIRSLYLESVHALNNALEAKDAYTLGHALRVARYTDMITARLDLSVEERENIHISARLHDIGKIGIRDGVLLKDRRLTPDEFTQIREHPSIGARILAPITDIADVRSGVLYHHERWDGKGYPEGLAGPRIPLGARALFIADAFDAMTTDRTYVKARSFEFAIAEILRCAGTQFDPELAEIFGDAMREVIREGDRAESIR